MELFRKPQTCTTPAQWAKYVYTTRIKNPRTKVVVLLFDSASRVPEVKDLCHLGRNKTKRKRGFIPLPKDFRLQDDEELPAWAQVTGSKHVLPAVWSYLIGKLKELIKEDMYVPGFLCAAEISHHTDFLDRGMNKTVYFDTPLCPRLAAKCEHVNGQVQLAWSNFAEEELPGGAEHLYGEGDLKVSCLANFFSEGRRLS